MAEPDAELYRKLAAELTQFATGLVGPNDAGDVVSDAVVRCLASKHWASVTEKRAYLYRSVYHEALRARRAQARRRSREEKAAQPWTLDLPELRPDVQKAIAQLSLRQRAVVVLTYWDDLTPRSIAALLRISDGAVRRHLARARSHLREVLNADN